VTPLAEDITRYRAAHERVLGRIEAAAARVARDAGSVQLVGVSKTVPLEQLRAAVAAGITVLGENRVQEAMSKIAGLPSAEWHLIGQLQGNKAGRALEFFDVIQSVDSVGLAERLSRLSSQVGGSPQRVLLQVNVDADPAKAGFLPGSLDEALSRLLELTGLQVEGLMTVGRYVERAEDARPTFVSLRRLSERLRAGHPGLGGQLSMGMSLDFEIAVEEGSTIVRVGRALFGDRLVVT